MECNNVSNFRDKGFCVALDIVPVQVIDEVKDMSLSFFEHVQEFVAMNGLDFGIGAKNGFKEIVERHPNRFEVPYRMSECLERTEILKHIEPLAKAILGLDAQLVNCSLLMSLAGTEVNLAYIYI
jgi:hypothetical protein